MTSDWDWIEKDHPPPAGLVPCPHCLGNCAEAAWVNDRHGRGKVVRISAMCDSSLDLQLSGKFDKDDFRTEFAPEAEAVAEWNEMMRRE